jgi:NIMA (never in mitosis gene a)-related kinase
MSSDLEALARLLRVAPESQTADDADEEGRRLEAFAMDLATAKATAGDDRASTETFCALVQGRLLSRAYRLPPGAPGAASPGSVLRVVQCVRLMLRHGPFVARLGEIAGAAEALGDKFRAYADLHRAHGDVSLAEPADGVSDEASEDADAPSATSPFAFREEILRELASVFKKVATTPRDAARGGTDASSTRDPPDENLPDAAHVVSIGLLSTRDPSLLASALVILRATTSRGGSNRRALAVARADCFHRLVAALREYAAPFDRLAADVLQNLSRLAEGRDGARAAGAVRVALELIQSPEGGEAAPAPRDSKRALALRVLCGLLQDRAAVAEARAAGAPAVVTRALRRAIDGRSGKTEDESATACLCCSALTRLAADDDGGEAVARADGVYALGRALVVSKRACFSVTENTENGNVTTEGRTTTTRVVVDETSETPETSETSEPSRVPETIERETKKALVEETCARAFRALRFVFSCDRDRVRVAFKPLFPPDLFAAFIDVGQYKPELDLYEGLVAAWLAQSDPSAARFADALEKTLKPADPPDGFAPDGLDGFAFDDWRARLPAGEAGDFGDPHPHRLANAPRVVRGYALVECLGEGAFGKVHRALRARGGGGFGAAVGGGARAVKEMFPEEEGGSFSEPNAKSDAAARFAEAVAREVRILSKLHHPNIVRYVESFADAGSVFIVMELAEGASLAERIAGFRSANARAPEPFLWDVHTQVLLALRYLESEAGVVHRDITPNNILVDRDARRVKLVDFGLAKALGPRSVASSGDANGERDSESNAAVGTMPYSAPEMIMREPYGHKADVWSLGCVLYHAAALTPAFGGSNPLTVASQIVEGRFERLEDATPPGAYSRNLLDAVGAMLVVDPAARPSAEAAAARRCDLVMREADRAREECDRAREELRRERLERNLEASMERRRRDAAAAFERRGAKDDDERRADAVDPRGLRRATSIPGPERADGGNRVKIAPGRLRAVHDPATELLAVMHKLAFVDRLPPSAPRDARRAVARRFAEYVFSAARSAGAVKAEAAKLLQASPDATPAGASGAGAGETYEDVARVLEELLLEHGFYAAARAESR